ncbi:MAG: SAM-dependent methyltransferase, partial [Myxococcota bacterium]
ANLVMSDMAPFTKGHRFTDHMAQLALARAALRLARHLLHPGGDFIVKVFDGEEAHDFVMDVRKHFGKVRRIKPKATRNESVEFFVVARGFRVASRLAIPTAQKTAAQETTAQKTAAEDPTAEE